MSSARQQILAAARRAGVEPQLRRAQRALAPRTERRDLRDRDHLRLLMALWLPADASCIDVGANIGEVLGTMVELAPNGRHVAYEPLPELAAELARRFPGVDVRQAAAADRSGTETFHRNTEANTRSSLSPLDVPAESLESFAVPLERLDDALPAGFAPALLKIDAEGAEGLVLAGAQRVLAEHGPVVVVEHGAAAVANFGQTSRDVFGLLTAPGLRVFDIDGGGPLDEAAFVAAATAGRLWTFVAHR